MGAGHHDRSSLRCARWCKKVLLQQCLAVETILQA